MKQHPCKKALFIKYSSFVSKKSFLATIPHCIFLPHSLMMRICKFFTIVFGRPSAYSPNDMWSSYNLQLDIIRQDFKSGLEGLLRTSRIRAIFLGVRIGDPTAV